MRMEAGEEMQSNMSQRKTGKGEENRNRLYEKPGFLSYFN
jgi:hypothetical protein